MAEPSPFPYNALEPDQIRLIKIQNGEWEDEIRCALIAVALEEVPYLAISYTWGRATEIWHTHPDDLKLPGIYDIQVNGTPFKVTQNLYHLLRDLRGHSAPNVLLWVDAICINQADDSEKTLQVDRMGQIYSSADSVYVWLGRADKNTEKPQSDFDEHAYVPFLDVNNPGDERQMKQLGLDKYEVSDLEDLHCFLQRRWFRRLWTVQEIALAKHLVFRCSGFNFEWRCILHTSRLLALSHLGDLLHRIIQWRCSDSGIGGIPSLSANGLDIACRTREVLRAEQLKPEIFLHDMAYCTEQQLRDNPIVLLFILAISLKGLAATDPRDKIFGLLGIVERTRNTLRLSPLQYKADYSESAVDVFCEVMRSFLSATGSLNILSLVQGCESMRMPDLPSWTPDFSTPWLVAAFQEYLTYDNAHGGRPINASHDVWRGFLVEGRKLRVHSLLFGVVTDIATSSDGYDWSEPFESFAALLLKRNKDPFRTGDVFWKTLMAYETLTKANQEGEADFRSTFRHFIMYTIASHHVRHEETSQREVFAGFENLQQLMKLDTTGSLPTETEVFECCDTLRSWGDDWVMHGQRFIDSVQSKGIKWRGRSTGLLFKHAFLLHNGYLGYGSIDTNVGDEVHIVSDGALMPLAFRRKGYANPPQKLLVGEAYVSGIMYGEGVDHCYAQGQEWSQIDVV